MRRFSFLLLIMALTTLYAQAGNTKPNADDAPFWTGKPDAAAFTKIQDDRLAKAQQTLDRMLAEKASQKVQAFATDLSLNRGVYDALSAMDLKEADAETRYYVEKTLRDFRLAGVDKDEATRKKIKALRDELVLIGQEFSRNIRDDKRTVIVNDVAELDGRSE